MPNPSPIIVCLREIGGESSIRLHGSFGEDDLPFERLKSISLLGTYSDYTDIESLVGDLLEFEISAESANAPSYQGIGRLADVHVSMTGQENEVVQRLGRLNVSKISEQYRRRKSQRKRFCSYVLEPRVSNWQSSKLFQWSYDGTITARKMRTELAIDAGRIKIDIDRHYYYRKLTDIHAVEQSWLPYLSVVGTTARGQNYYESRDITLVQSSILLLSFIYNVNLELTSKTKIDGHGIENIYWPSTNIETTDRDFFDFAIEVEQLNEFLNVAFQNVRREEFGLDRLNVILRRYINGTRATSLESRITYISEAIEGIIAFAGLRDTAGTAQDQAKCVGQIQTLLDNSKVDGKERAKERAVGLFQQPAWEGVKAIIEWIYPASEHFRDICLERGRFFSIRNRVVHRGETAWDNDIYLQIDIASYVFKLLFCYVVGCSHVRPRPGHSLEYAISMQESDEPKRVFLWE